MKQWVNQVSAAILGGSMATTAYAGPSQEEMIDHFFGTTALTNPNMQQTRAQEFNNHLWDNHSLSTPTLVLDKEYVLRQAPDTSTQEFWDGMKNEIIMANSVLEGIPYSQSLESFDKYYKEIPGFKKTMDGVINSAASNGNFAQPLPDGNCFIVSTNHTLEEYLISNYTNDTQQRNFTVSTSMPDFERRQAINIHEAGHCHDTEARYALTTHEEYINESVADIKFATEALKSGATIEDIETAILFRTTSAIKNKSVKHFTSPSLQKLISLPPEDIQILKEMSPDEIDDFSIEFVRDRKNHLTEEELDKVADLILESPDNDSLNKAMYKSAYQIGLQTAENIHIPNRFITPKQTAEVVASENNLLSEEQSEFLKQYLLPYGNSVHSAIDYEQGLTGSEDTISKALYEKVMPQGKPTEHSYTPMMPRPTLSKTPPKELARHKLHNAILNDVLELDEDFIVIDIPTDEREYKLEKWIRAVSQPDYEIPEHLDKEDIIDVIGMQKTYIAMLRSRESTMQQNNNAYENHKEVYSMEK